MERRYYTRDDLAATLAHLEERFGVSSTEFYEGFRHGERFGAPWPVANLWAGLWEEYERLAELEEPGELARSVERLVAIA